MGRTAPAAVIFDLDGVLTDTAEYHYLGWQRLADEEGIAFDREANEALRGVSRAESLRRLLGDREVSPEVFEEMMARKNGYYLGFLEGMSPRDLLPGAVALVVDAKRRGLAVAIGSSSKNAPFVLDRLGIAALFDAVADGNTVEQAKPAPDLFLAAAELVGVPPERCIVIEDAASGVDAAIAGGMIAVGIGPDERVGHAHHRFATTADVDLAEVVAPHEVRLDGGPLLADGWVVVGDHHDPEQVANVATAHLTGNGYLGYRGTLPEWDASATVGCTVSDTWDNADGKWTELTNVPNGLYARWSAAGAPVLVPSDGLISDRDRLERRLDVRYGRQHRVWEPAVGRITRLEDERFASMDELHLVAQCQRLAAAPGTRLTLATGIDGEVWSLNGDHFRSLTGTDHGDAVSMLGHTTEHGLPIAVAQVVRVTGGEVRAGRTDHEGRRLVRTLEIEVSDAGEVRVEQVMTVHSGNDADDPLEASLALARRALEDGYDLLLARHAIAWDRLWDRVDVRIDGDPAAQAVVRYNVYQNVIATPMHADHLPIGARGLSCQAYQGAAFWDQEVFNLPMWLHTVPEVARRILVYRYRTLDGARRKAERLGYAGAFYAWISGATGDELCPDLFFVDVLTGRPIRNHFNDWQIHISPDIAVTVGRYVATTGDRRFLLDHGAEIVLEVARFLASFVHLRPHDGAYHLIRLLGPDEYHENVDDNVFTLEQARRALEGAVALWDELEAQEPGVLDELRRRLHLDGADRALWSDIAARLAVVPPDPDTLVLEQFAGYLDLEDVTPDELRSRLRHPDEYWGWPNGVAVRTQVLKQADVVQLFACQPDRYPREVMAANLAYYLPRTQHGSSLSRPTYGLVAAWLGELDLAAQLFMAGATVDLLATSHPAPGGTFIGGIHTAACGATWQVAVLGFGGVRVEAGRVSLAPRLPAGWAGLGFGLAVDGGWLEVEATHERVVVEVARPTRGPIELEVHGTPAVLEPGARIEVGIAPGS